MLDRRSPKQLNEQLTALLRDELTHYSTGDKFLTERQLCEKYKVSRPIVRLSISHLIQDGLLESLPPKGTFVKNPTLPKAKSDSYRIGVVCPISSSYPHIDAIKGIQNVLNTTPHEMMVIDNSTIHTPSSEIISETIGKRKDIDGFIWISTFLTELKANSHLNDMARNLVLINDRVKSGGISTIIADYEEAEYQLTMRLIEQGHKNIAYIGGPQHRLSAQQRLTGFTKAIQDGDISMNNDIIIPFTDLNSRDAANEIILPMLKQFKSIDSIILYNDFYAHQALEILKQMGRKIPEEISVVGFDDLSIANECVPSLTTSRIPYQELGELAIQTLLNQMSLTTKPGVKQYLSCPIIERESTGAK